MVLLAACQPQPADPAVTGAWVRLPAVRENPGAAYFVLKGGKDADALVKVSTPVAVRTELHESTPGGPDSMMTMQALKEAPFPAHGTLEFAPGGKHVMLFDVSPHVQPGDTVPLTLSLAGGRQLQTQAKVIGAGDPAPKF
jgi:copper(I)-binding protein